MSDAISPPRLTMVSEAKDDPRFGVGPYATWKRQFLRNAGSVPGSDRAPRLREDELDHLFACVLTLAARGDDGHLSSGRAMAIIELTGLQRGYTASYLVTLLETSRRSGQLRRDLLRLAGAAGSLEAGGLMRGVPRLADLLRGMGTQVCDVLQADRDGCARRLEALVAGVERDAAAARPATGARVATTPGPSAGPTPPSRLPSPYPRPPVLGPWTAEDLKLVPGGIRWENGNEGWPDAPPAPAPGQAPLARAGDPGVEAALAEIRGLVGLDEVKAEVGSLVNTATVMAARRRAGLRVPVASRHPVFTGNPGTGKTTVARLVSQVYGRLGLLSKGHLVERDRSTLVAGYLGQTAIKTREAVEQAIGGILFVDEAYTLVNGDAQDSFGLEAVETLMKAMEDHRDNLVVVLAGYGERMARFIASNPGLASRLPRTIDFADYGPQEMLAIIGGCARAADYRFDAAARPAVGSVVRRLCAGAGEGFGNGRLARNLFEAIVARQADRVAALPAADRDALAMVTAADVEAASVHFV